MKETLSRLAFWLLALALAFPLALFGWLGLYSRYLADDYCHSAQLLSYPTLWQAILANYYAWSGRFSNLLVVQVTDWLGLPGVMGLPLLTIGLALLALVWLFSGLSAFQGRIRWEAVLLAESTLFVALYLAPNLYQVLYWRAAAIAYSLPLFVVTLGVAWLKYWARHPYPLWIGGAILFGLTFFAGGSSETVGAWQVGVYLLLLGYAWIARRPPRLRFLSGVGLAAALLAMIIVALAPGNAVRLGERAPVSSPIPLALRTLGFVGDFLGDTLRTTPVPWLFLCAFSFFLGVFLLEEDQNFAPQTLLWTLVFTITLIAFSFAPSAYAQSYPVERARFPAVYTLAWGLGWMGFIGGTLARPHLRRWSRPGLRGVFVGLFIVYLFRAGLSIAPRVEEYSHRALAWDRRQALLLQQRAQGVQEIVLTPLNSVYGIKELDVNPRHWVNRCAARFYDVQSIRVR